MAKTIKLTSERYGKTFNARFVAPGDMCGASMNTEHEGKPVVEIYDAGYNFVQCPETGEVLGQMVSTYYAETLLGGRVEDKKAYGLDLHGGVDSWKLDAPAFNELHDALVDWVTTYEEEQAPSAPAP